jgi:hypothetical protein
LSLLRNIQAKLDGSGYLKSQTSGRLTIPELSAKPMMKVELYSDFSRVYEFIVIN